jgi:hypothetical protein
MFGLILFLRGTKGMDHVGDCVGNSIVGNSIIEINRRSVFSLEEAQEVLPVIFKLTKTYSQKVESLIARIDSLGGSSETLTDAIEAQVNSLIQEWQCKIQKLGALPKGLWIADFDSGDGYFCWKFPERGIEFWHKYSDGYSKRVRVSERFRPINLEERLRERAMNNDGAPMKDGAHPDLTQPLGKKISTFTPRTLQPTE